MAVKNTQIYKVSPNFDVVVTKTTGAFRKVLVDITEDSRIKMVAFRAAYPEIPANNDLPPDQMAVFLLGRKGFTVNPETLHYDEACGILSLQIIIIEDARKQESPAIFFAQLRETITIQKLNTLVTSRANLAFRNDAGASISVSGNDPRARVITPIKPASTRPI